MAAGFSKGQAVRAQLVTAGGAMLGAMLAVKTGAAAEPKLLLNFVAGGFIYVATVDVLPSLLRTKTSLLQTCAEVAAMCAGIGMMLLVMQFE